MEDLDNVLWVTGTTPKKVIGKTLFELVYGSKVVAPNRDPGRLLSIQVI